MARLCCSRDRGAAREGRKRDRVRGVATVKGTDGRACRRAAAGRSFVVTVNVHMASTWRSRRGRGSAGCREDASWGSSLGTIASTRVSLVCTLVNWVEGSSFGFFPETPRKKASFPPDASVGLNWVMNL